MGSKQLLPQARTDKLVVHTLPDETLVYDLKSHKAHCLNEAATLVWNNCDGHTTVSAMTSILEEKMKVPVDQGIVWFTLERLEKAELLREKIGNKSGYGSMSRRDVVKKLGIGAAVSAPLILSLIAPQAVQAVSCLPCGSTCVPAGVKCCDPCNCTGATFKTCTPK